MMIFENAEAAFEIGLAGLLYGGLAAAYLSAIALIIRESVRR
jgi:hypothetical protein